MTILDRFAIPGQVAIVTGAGRGLGPPPPSRSPRPGPTSSSPRAPSDSSTGSPSRSAGPAGAVVVPADLSYLGAVAGLALGGVRRLGRLDTVVNNVGGTFPTEFLKTTDEFLDEGLPVQRHHGARADPRRRTADAQGRRRRPEVRGHDQLDDGPHRRPRLHRLRHREGGAGALDEDGGAGPRATDPGQRHLRRVDHDQRSGVRRRAAQS